MQHKKDIAGQRFGKLTAIERTDRKKVSVYIWRCRCDCGKEIELPLTYLTNGSAKSCGCNHLADIAGQRFGRLTAIERTDKKEKNGTYLWRCVCDCGREVELGAYRLKNGRTKSCGCGKFKDVNDRHFGKKI